MTWKLVYKHDEHGSPQAGSKRALIKAVENGAAIRFAQLGEAEGHIKTHVFAANPVMSLAGHVHAQCSLVAYQFGETIEELPFTEEHMQFVMTVSTKGEFRGRRIYVDGLRPNSTFDGNFGISWFADL